LERIKSEAASERSMPERIISQSEIKILTDSLHSKDFSKVKKLNDIPPHLHGQILKPRHFRWQQSNQLHSK
jgi:hypothetical protein